jgi:predicted Zn-dependent protease
MAGLLLSAIQPALGAAALGASATVQLKYQREFEQEADYLGLRFLRKAGFEPHGMGSFMKRMLEEQRTQPLEILPYMLSHPLTDERITNLQDGRHRAASWRGCRPSCAR